MKEQELKKSFSQMSLEERKTKKVSQKNSTRKKTVSAATATERTSLQETEEITRPSNKRESMEFLLKFLLHSTISLVTPCFFFSYKNSSVFFNLFPTKLRMLRI